CLIRGVNHPHPRHGWGLYYNLTGRPHDRPDLDAPPTPDDFPGIGAVVTRLGRQPRHLPPAVTVPRWNRFLDLPNDYAREQAGPPGGGSARGLVKPAGGGEPFGLDGLARPADAPPGRRAERRDLLGEGARRLGAWADAAAGHDTLRARAVEILGSAAVRRAFE